jgi:glycosyltransferase involved in cell wall biosynthesis
VVAQLLGVLADHHELAVITLRAPGTPPLAPELASRCAIVREVSVHPNRFGGQAWRHRQRVLTMPFTHLPTRVAVAHSRRLVKAARELAAEFAPDIIQVEDDSIAYCAAALAGGLARVVLVAHDPGLGVAQGQVEVTGGRQEFAHRMDEAEWRGYWRRTLPHVDAAVTFTDGDAALLRREVPGVDVETIPLGIDIPPATPTARGSGDPSVLFVGGYGHPPNEDAALRLQREIMPRVRERRPGLALTLVGIDPTGAMHAAAGPDDDVTGRVDSVTPYVDRAAVIALPIRLGGGMRVKLLEAMAAGKVIVATPLAAAGLDVRDGEQIVLAETDAQFADAIDRLLDDPRRRAEIGACAREWAIANLSWESRRDRYEALYRRLLSRRASEMSSAAR